MKKILLLAGAAALFAVNSANAQENVNLDLPCVNHYLTNKTSNWFIEIGAGAELPVVEGWKDKKHYTANYDLGFGKWFSPYFAWRLEAGYGSMHFNNVYDPKKVVEHSKVLTGNLDLIWNLFNSLGGVHQGRFFNINPFIGAGLAYTWDFKNDKKLPNGNVPNGKGVRGKELVPQISAGLQFNFRLSNSFDFFLQARAMATGDNFNNIVGGKPADLNLSAIGGFIWNIGGKSFQSFNPCDYSAYINSLNGQINTLRGDLAATAAALAAAEAQLPCPEVVAQQVVVEQEEVVLPLLGTVRFTINSATVSSMEKVNIYNVAEFMKANPDQNVAIVGYADKKTGTAAYNQALSERRAQAVAKILTDEYGISKDRLAISGQGSSVQPYDTNNWNRIVIMSAE